MDRYLSVETRTEKVANGGSEAKINGLSTTYIIHVPNPFAQIPPTLPHLLSVVFVGSN